MFGQLPQFHLKVVPKPWVLTFFIHKSIPYSFNPAPRGKLWRMPGAKALVALVFAGAFGPFARLPRKATLGHARNVWGWRKIPYLEDHPW